MFFRSEVVDRVLLPFVASIEAVQGTSSVLRVEKKTGRKQLVYSAYKPLALYLAMQFCHTVRVPDSGYFQMLVDHTDWIVHTVLADLAEVDSVHNMARNWNTRFQLVHMELTVFAQAGVDYIADSTFVHKQYCYSFAWGNIAPAN